MSSKGNNHITMVERAMQVLEELFYHNALGVTKLAHNLNLPKATVFRILQTLHEGGFVRKDADDQYELGFTFVQYAAKIKGRLTLEDIAKSEMEGLAKEVGESVNLVLYYKGNMVNIFNIEGESSILVSKLIPVAPLNCSSTGKVILSQWDDEEICSYFEEGNKEGRTRHSIMSMEAFSEELKLIRKQGIAYDREEYEYGLSCMACPIFNSNHEAVAALSISGPTSRLEYKDFDKLAEALLKTTNSVNQKIKEHQLI